MTFSVLQVHDAGPLLRITGDQWRPTDEFEMRENKTTNQRELVTIQAVVYMPMPYEGPYMPCTLQCVICVTLTCLSQISSVRCRYQGYIVVGNKRLYIELGHRYGRFYDISLLRHEDGELRSSLGRQ